MALSIHERLICFDDAAVAVRLVGAGGAAAQAIVGENENTIKVIDKKKTGNSIARFRMVNSLGSMCLILIYPPGTAFKLLFKSHRKSVAGLTIICNQHYLNSL